MWIDKYLKFNSEAEANSVLYTTHPAQLDDDGVTVSEEYTTPNYMNIDVLGVLYENQPIPDPENPPTPIPVPGWHVNVRVLATEDVAPLEPYAIEPAFPRRVWC